MENLNCVLLKPKGTAVELIYFIKRKRKVYRSPTNADKGDEIFRRYKIYKRTK